MVTQMEWTRRCPATNKARFHCRDLNTGSFFISQDERISKYDVQSLEKAVGPCLISTGGLASI